MTATITKEELQKALTSKFGFEPSEGGKHEKFTLSRQGKKVATTFFSRNLRSSVLAPTLLRSIASQIRLGHGSLPTLRGMVSCSVSQDDYLRLLKDAGFLD